MSAPASPSPADLSHSSDEDDGMKESKQVEERKGDALVRGKKFIPLCEVYSVTSPCVTASGSKKVTAAARKLPKSNGNDQLAQRPISVKPCLTQVYSRRWKKEVKTSSFHGSIVPNLVVKSEELEGDEGGGESGNKQRRVEGSAKLVKTGFVDKSSSRLDDQTQPGDGSGKTSIQNVKKRKNFKIGINDETSSRKSENHKSETETELNNSGAGRMKWVRLSFAETDPKKFVGLDCKVYWPLDAVWYCGHVVDYNSEMSRHVVKYEDGELEYLILSNEQVKFHVSLELMKRSKLKFREKSLGSNGLDVNEMMALAASLDDSEEIETGDVIWAKLTGHAFWPAIVLDESHLGNHKGLSKISGENSVLVQFFGTHDFARVKWKQVISFLKGLLSSYHSKCKKPTFVRGLEEAKMYLNEQRLPEIMLKLRQSVNADVNYSGSGEHQNDSDLSDKDCMSDDEIKKFEDLQRCPLEVGDLQIASLGKIVKDSDNFQNDRFIWPEGYTSMRMFPSVTDPSLDTLYKMEVLRDADSRSRPLFRVTTENGEEFNGPTPSACWNKIYKRIQVVQIGNQNYKADKQFASGSSMFGFSHPKISKLIKELSNSRPSLKSSQVASRKTKGFPVGYRSVHVEWRDLDKCNVCHMDEEYESNLFIQCDKCRMMVHARCYGESETTDDALWLCNLCCLGAQESPPPCCLCPVVGGAMKPTTDGRWAHLACAIWIPETCLSDIKKMEPIDGISRINKDRWKLMCSICGVSHGACIQCSNYNCRVAYHPLCARAAGFCLETENKDRHLIPTDDDEENQCIQLLSFCRRHRPLSCERLQFNERGGQEASEHSDYVPPANPSGCARTEPYTSLGKRQKSESEVPAASSKRLYVENMPYLLGGSSPHMPLWNKSSSECSRSVDLQKLRTSQLEASAKILSVADKYNFMRNTFRKRLAFGKSHIHGFGVFTKLQHRAGDMVIEYTGELIRPLVADRREHLIYNSLVVKKLISLDELLFNIAYLTLEVESATMADEQDFFKENGAGTYMFRIDDERVIDATRAGSIAQLINHSCEPNCYSRVIGVNGDDHIIIFAKRDLKQWEELTYDYRFVSSDQKLVCHCGFSRCRGVVNDIESEERAAKLHVLASELMDWQGE